MQKKKTSGSVNIHKRFLTNIIKMFVLCVEILQMSFIWPLKMYFMKCVCIFESLSLKPVVLRWPTLFNAMV